MKRLVASALLLATASGAGELDAGADVPLAVYALRAELLTPDAGWVEPEGDGVWLPTPRAVETGRQLEQLRAENLELKAAPPGLRPVVIAAWVGFACGVLSGAIIGWKVAEAVRR